MKLLLLLVCSRCSWPRLLPLFLHLPPLPHAAPASAVIVDFVLPAAATDATVYSVVTRLNFSKRILFPSVNNLYLLASIAMNYSIASPSNLLSSRFVHVFFFFPGSSVRFILFDFQSICHSDQLSADVLPNIPMYTSSVSIQVYVCSTVPSMWLVWVQICVSTTVCMRVYLCVGHILSKRLYVWCLLLLSFCCKCCWCEY